MALDPAVIREAELTEERAQSAIVGITGHVFSAITLDVAAALPLRRPVTRFRETVTSMVGLAGAYSGLLSLHCPQRLAIRISACMLGAACSKVDADVRDAMGEMANMIGGDVKALFSPRGSGLSLSIPTVVYGSDYAIRSLSEADTLMLPFACAGDEFLLSFRIRRS